MKNTKLMLILIAICALLSCQCSHEDIHRQIKIVNLSGKDIAYQVSIDNNDSGYYCSNKNTIILRILTADSSAILNNPDYYTDWETDLSKGHILNILIADAEMFKKHFSDPCDTISKYVPILHRYQLKLKDLEQINWTITYPRTQ